MPSYADFRLFLAQYLTDKALKTLGYRGVRNVAPKLVELTGGEPLVRKGMPTLVDMLARIPGIKAATSAAMAAELRAGGFVDAAGFITVDGDQIAAMVLANPGAFPTISSQPRITAVRFQVKTMRAEHSMYADYTQRNLAFFERFNPNPARR